MSEAPHAHGNQFALLKQRRFPRTVTDRSTQQIMKFCEAVA